MNDCSPESAALLKLHCRDFLTRRTSKPCREADVLREETDRSTGGVWRGMGPDNCTRIAEITSGRTISQQGLAATCRDPLYRETKSGGRAMVWRMSLYELRRKGNAFRGGAGRRSGEGNTHARRRGSGHLAVLEHARTPSRENVCSLSMDEPMGKPAVAGAHVSPHLNLAGAGKAHGEKPRSEPDSGNPTVRDRRGAPGNVAHGGNVNPPRNRKGGAGNPPPKSARARDLSRQSKRLPSRFSEDGSSMVTGACVRCGRIPRKVCGT